MTTPDKGRRLNDPSNEETGDNPRGRERSYRAGARIARERMAREAPLHEQALREVEASDVVVVEGTYDQVQLVLRALEIPYTLIAPDHLRRVSLRPEQLLVVNCPGQVGRRGVGRVRSFVEAGGSLFTTDWALRHVIEPAFPGVLEYNERPTADDVVRIEVHEHDNSFVKGVLDSGDDPLWWLEGSSYPIRILAPERVQVLLTSRELETRYGEAPVAVLFRHGEGEVFHMISHYYLQRTELRSARHRQKACTYADAKDVALDEATLQAMQDLSLGEVESAATSARFLANLVGWKKEISRRRSTKQRSG